MIITYFQQYKTSLLYECVNLRGFICPYNLENCLYMDSLSMTRTVNFGDCRINSNSEKIDNQINNSEFISNKN